MSEDFPEEPTDLPPEYPPQRYFLSVGCMFKNESNSICEWVEHYLHHGVDHCFLINDNSTDNSLELLAPYIASQKVTVFNGEFGYYLGRQKDMYNHFLLPNIREKTKWLIIVDMDEYLWSQKSVDLKTVFSQCDNYAQIQFEHTLFGSNGHIEQPTDGIVRNFTMRCADRPTKFTQNLKYAIHTDYDYSSLNVHHATPRDHTHLEKDYFIILGEPWLLLNHYCCQSFEFWKQIKCTRGDGDHYRQRQHDYFHEYDKNDVEDLELLEQNTT